MWCALLREPREHKYSCADLAHGVFDFIFALLARQQPAFREELPITVLYAKNKAEGKKKRKNLSVVVCQMLLSKAPSWNML